MSTPVIGVITGNVERLQQYLQLPEECIFALTKDIRQYDTGHYMFKTHYPPCNARSDVKDFKMTNA